MPEAVERVPSRPVDPVPFVRESGRGVEDDGDVVRVTLRVSHDRGFVHEPMVPVEAEGGIGGPADLLRLSPDRGRRRRRASTYLRPSRNSSAGTPMPRKDGPRTIPVSDNPTNGRTRCPFVLALPLATLEAERSREAAARRRGRRSISASPANADSNRRDRRDCLATDRKDRGGCLRDDEQGRRP